MSPRAVSISPQSCRDCGAWALVVSSGRCRGCQNWHDKRTRPPGACTRCGRELPLRRGWCRGCCLHLHLQQDAVCGQEMFTQLWIADPLPVGLRTARAPTGGRPEERREEPDRPLRLVRAPCALFAQPTLPGQQLLFGMRRDWSPLVDIDRRSGHLPELSATAWQLVSDFDRMMREQHWTKMARWMNRRTLTILVSWLGADAPILESDVYDLARAGVNLAAKRVCQFLKGRGLLIEDPTLHQDRDQRWINQALAALPPMITNELRTWVSVLRGEGRREHEAISYWAIRRYLFALRPVLDQWIAENITSLREISAPQVRQSVTASPGSRGRTLLIALRSLFRALKQERIIFRDPTRGLVLVEVENLPRRIPADRLQGLLEHARGAFGKLVLALAAVHALPPLEITRLLTADLDLARGRLDVRRGHQRHTLHLEDLTYRLTAEWLAERHRRWPHSTNPHLLVSQQTALDADHPSVVVSTLKGACPSLEMSLWQLREDRILDEARLSADPLRLMRLFGISIGAAMRYVAAAHPEKCVRPLR